MIRRAVSNPVARAFTLFELLIVVGIILLLLTLIAPSVADLVKSNNYTSAVNQLTGTLEAARARAIATNKQTAVAVLFDIETRQARLVILEEDSSRADLAEQAATQAAQDVTAFVPTASVAPVVLPEGIMIFGLSAHHLIPDGPNDRERIDSYFGGNASYEDHLISDPNDPGVSDDERGQATAGWYAGSIITDANGDDLINPWLAPRNDPRVYLDARLGQRDIDSPLREPAQVEFADIWRAARDVGSDLPVTPGFGSDPDDAVRYVRHAQTFMIRFSSNGSIVAFQADATQGDQTGYAYIEDPAGPIAAGSTVPEAMAGAPFDSPTRFDPETLPRDRSDPFREPTTFNYESAGENPEVLLRAAVRLAVVDLQDLERGTGIDRPWALHPALTDDQNQAPWPDSYLHSDDSEIQNNDPQLDQFVRDMSDWIDRNSVIIDFSRHSGKALRR